MATHLFIITILLNDMLYECRHEKIFLSLLGASRAFSMHHTTKSQQVTCHANQHRSVAKKACTRTAFATSEE